MSQLAVSADLRARLSSSGGWKQDRFGNWVLGQRRFKVAVRTLKHQRKVADRWVTATSWYFSKIDWAMVDKLRARDEQEHSRAMEQARQFQAEHPDKAVDVNVAVKVTENHEKDGVEIRFSEKPSDSLLTQLREHGFHWSKRQRLWYARRTPKTVAFASGLKGPAVKPPEGVPTAPFLICNDGNNFMGAVERSGDNYRGSVNGQSIEAPADQIIRVLHEAGVAKVVGTQEPVHRIGVVIAC